MAVDPISEYYLRQAQAAKKMASQVSNEDTRRAWLDLARDWLMMIPQGRVSETQRFDNMVRDFGTGQKQSEAEN